MHRNAAKKRQRLIADVVKSAMYWDTIRDDFDYSTYKERVYSEIKLIRSIHNLREHIKKFPD